MELPLVYLQAMGLMENLMNRERGMKKVVVACAVISFMTCGCSGPNTTAGNISTGATLAALANTPGAGLIGIGASIVDFGIQAFSGIGKPKIGKGSPKLMYDIQRTPGIIGWNEDGSPKWGAMAIWRENDERKTMKLQEIPVEKLDIKLAYTRAVTQLPQEIFSADKGIQEECSKIWENGGLVVVEYHGTGSGKVIAVSDKNEPFELMLPEEWEARKANILTSKK